MTSPSNFMELYDIIYKKDNEKGIKNLRIIMERKYFGNIFLSICKIKPYNCSTLLLLKTLKVYLEIDHCDILLKYINEEIVDYKKELEGCSHIDDKQYYHELYEDIYKKQNLLTTIRDEKINTMKKCVEIFVKKSKSKNGEDIDKLICQYIF